MPQKKNNSKTSRGANRRAGNSPVLTKQDHTVLIAKELRIKPKTKAFYDEVINNPKTTQQKAYIDTHVTNSKNTANVEANRLLKSPKYEIYKASAVGKAKRKIVSLIDSDNENIALKASESVIDRVEGKAVQKSENLTRTVEVKLDLTGVRLGSHAIQAPQLEQLDVA